MSGVSPARRLPVAPAPVRRVRHEVRDGLLVMGFSLAMSSVLALLLTLLVHVGN